ncbi:glycine-rich SFCGS family protein [Klebsiella pneumoniae subsp. pneumoniae]|nr:glycine-rich SFCGS family protein [Klebsiella pneumoniae subsp. pneumoniae]
MATVWVKAKKVAAGAEKAGARAVVVPGVAADMKLGDIMKAENATFGISFCGSGGAGAITAQTKYGYKAKYGMRSIDEGRHRYQRRLQRAGLRLYG